MLQLLSVLLVLGLTALAVFLVGNTLAQSWNKVVLALAGPDAPVARRVHSAMRLRAAPRRSSAVVVNRERAWAAAF